jgi:hypothetical protein
MDELFAEMQANATDVLGRMNEAAAPGLKK